MMVQHIAIANRAGVNLGDLDELLKGRATANVAGRLGVTIGDVEEFVRGSASAGMAKRLDLAPLSAVDELARMAGKEGAIGIVIGLLMFDSD